MKSRKYYGVHSGWHDSSLAIINEKGELEFFAQTERFPPREKIYGCDLKPIEGMFPMPAKGDIIAAPACGFNSDELPGVDPRLAMKYIQHDYLVRPFPKGFVPQIAVSHHFCHILSSWLFRTSDEDRFCLGYDGSGCFANGILGTSMGGYISKNGFEFVEAAPVPSSALLGCILGPSSAGKAMGLAGYLPHVTSDVGKLDVVMLAHSMYGPHTGFKPMYPMVEPPYDNTKLEFVARFYKLWIEHTWNTLKVNFDQFVQPNQGVVIGGGTTLALELNTRISQLAKDVVFGPAATDCGLGLGAAAFAFYMDHKVWPRAIHTPALNHLPKPNPVVGPQKPAEIAAELAADKVICLVRGKGEAGPRALGFRSILARADRLQNLQRVSQGIKVREYYRPLAPVVTAEAFDKYFVGPKGQYMQFMVMCNELCQRELPAIVHKDLSSRPQVVYRENDPWLHELLVEFGNLTGHECLINTSLNGGGKPICNTLDDVREDMKLKDVLIISVKS